jgi:hypothetical protein
MLSKNYKIKTTYYHSFVQFNDIIKALICSISTYCGDQFRMRHASYKLLIKLRILMLIAGRLMV